MTFGQTVYISDSFVAVMHKKEAKIEFRNGVELYGLVNKKNKQHFLRKIEDYVVRTADLSFFR